MKWEKQDLNLVVWRWRSFGLYSQFSHYKQGIQLALLQLILTYETEMLPTCRLWGSICLFCKTCNGLHEEKAKSTIMEKNFSAPLQGTARIWKKLVLQTCMTAGFRHYHTFNGNFQVSKSLWESLNLNSMHKCKC